jgi:hypothetical protein
MLAIIFRILIPLLRNMTVLLLMHHPSIALQSGISSPNGMHFPVPVIVIFFCLSGGIAGLTAT